MVLYLTIISVVIRFIFGWDLNYFEKGIMAASFLTGFYISYQVVSFTNCMFDLYEEYVKITDRFNSWSSVLLFPGIIFLFFMIIVLFVITVVCLAIIALAYSAGERFFSTFKKDELKLAT